MAPCTPPPAPPPLSEIGLATGVGTVGGLVVGRLGELGGLEGLGELGLGSGGRGLDSGVVGGGVVGGGVVGGGVVGGGVVGGGVVGGGVVGGGVGTNCWHMPKLKLGGISTPLMMWITPFWAGIFGTTISVKLVPRKMLPFANACTLRYRRRSVYCHCRSARDVLYSTPSAMWNRAMSLSGRRM